MKKRNQVVLNLHGLSVPDKVENIQKSITSMTGNPKFPDEVERLLSLDSEVVKLQTCYKKANDSKAVSVTDTAVLNYQEDIVDREYTALKHRVEDISKGDELIIKSAGMEIKAVAAAIGIPKRAEYLKSSEGSSTGSINLKWISVKGARCYAIRLTSTIADNNSWKQAAIVTRASAAIDGLTSGTQYWFQVSAVGAAGQGPWSDPTTKVAP
jgi:hypothetical protein